MPSWPWSMQQGHAPPHKAGRKGSECSRGRRRVAHGDAGDLHVAKVGDVDRAALLVREGALELVCSRHVIVVVYDLQPSITPQQTPQQPEGAPSFEHAVQWTSDHHLFKTWKRHLRKPIQPDHCALHIQTDRVRLSSSAGVTHMGCSACCRRARGRSHRHLCVDGDRAARCHAQNNDLVLAYVCALSNTRDVRALHKSKQR